MISTEILTFSLIINFFLLLFFSYRIKRLFVSNQEIERLIYKYFEKNDNDIINIELFNSKEKIRYRIPLFSIFRIYNYSFGIISGKIEFYRKVEIISNNKTMINYVEIINDNKNINFKILDKYIC